MLLIWKVNYLDSRDGNFKERSLYLDTETLGLVTKAAVELANEERHSGCSAGIIKFRHFFREQRPSEEAIEQCVERSAFIVLHYCEDEEGKQLSHREREKIFMDSRGREGILISPGDREYDVTYRLANVPEVNLEEIVLGEEDIGVLGCFSRDLREMRETLFFRDGQCSFNTCGSDLIVETSFTSEEARSFVMIFRRLYMRNEPANFAKAAGVFCKALDCHPICDWMNSARAYYEAELEKVVDAIFKTGGREPTFSTKRLIDVFLNTQYAHQPDERRLRQYRECLEDVAGKRAFLEGLFYREIRGLAIEISNAGGHILDFYFRYCQVHDIDSETIPALGAMSPGMGALETEADRRARRLAETIEEIAFSIWVDEGCPQGGPGEFESQAREQLEHACLPTGVISTEQIGHGAILPQETSGHKEGEV